MSAPQHRRYQVAVLGGITVLCVLSLIGLNIMLTIWNSALKQEQHRSQAESMLKGTYFRLRYLIFSFAELKPKEQMKQLQEFYNQEGLLMIQINGPARETLYARTDIPLKIGFLKKLSPQDLLEKQPKHDQVLVDFFTPQGQENKLTVLGRAIIFNESGLPKFYLFFARRAPPAVSLITIEQLALLFQVLMFLCLAALSWYFIRRLSRPYENLVKEIKKTPGVIPSMGKLETDDLTFLVGSFKGVINQLREKEKQLEELHRRALQRADSSEKFARDILAGLPLAVVSLDQNGHFLDCNPAFEALVGRKQVAFLNLTYQEILTASPQLVDAIKQFYTDHTPVSLRDAAIVNPPGEGRRVDVTISPLSDSYGLFYGAICALADVTEQNLLRQRITANENLAALGVMAAGIAHEFKNSLSTISGYSQMLLGNARPGAEQKRAGALVEEVDGMARVISEFLDYARPVPAEKVKVDLDTVLAELADFCRSRNPAITFNTDLVPARIKGDAHLLRKAFQNILLNSVQALTRKEKETGRVDIRLERLSGGVIRVQITDNGPGMDAQTLARIFTPFFTTRPEGTGMGLAVVQKIIAVHEGVIRVTSEPNQGTTFETDFPGQF